MKKVIFILWIMPVLLLMAAALGANKQKSRIKPVKPEAERYSPFGFKLPEKPENAGVFGFKLPDKLMNNEDFWKMLIEDSGYRVDVPVQKITDQDAAAIITMMNNVSDAFNHDYSFTKLDMPQFMSAFTMFLENPKNQLVLKRFLQVLKNKVDMPWFATCAVHIQQAIDNKNAEQFWFIYSDLEGYFREVSRETKPLMRITTGWRATIKNIKDSVKNRARRAYNYFF
jgi:hypothetical protein